MRNYQGREKYTFGPINWLKFGIPSLIQETDSYLIYFRRIFLRKLLAATVLNLIALSTTASAIAVDRYAHNNVVVDSAKIGSKDKILSKEMKKYSAGAQKLSA